MAILPRFAEQYLISKINGTRLDPYRTLYYETPDLALYLQHRSGVRPRCQVRLRERLGSGDRLFVEHGTHDELMRRAGIYADLFSTQAARYQETPR